MEHCNLSTVNLIAIRNVKDRNQPKALAKYFLLCCNNYHNLTSDITM